jgi:AraC family transcriptional regulator
LLARAWLDRSNGFEPLLNDTVELLAKTLHDTERPRHEPSWLGRVRDRLRLSPSQFPETRQLASELRMHPAWLAHAYREHEGEGLHETVRRRRVEFAASLIRATSRSFADVAALAGFCDQSHMNRAFRTVLVRTPGEVRGEIELLKSLRVNS